jgi:hypothetical protein
MNKPSYLTKEGAEKLRQEFEYLKGPARDALANRLRLAIQQGDLSENADYISAKEEQGFLEGRIAELTEILGHHQKRQSGCRCQSDHSRRRLSRRDLFLGRAARS